MRFCRNNYEDIRKYFQNSYMKFPSIGDEVVFVTNVSSLGMTGKQLPRDDSDGWQFTFDAGSGNTEVEFVLPHKSYFEYGKSAYLLSRIPAKQYHRGLTEDNTVINLLTTDGFVHVPLSLELVNAYTAKPSFQGFRANSVGYGYPVSPRIAVDPTGRIFVDRTRVGFFDAKSGTINCNQEVFLPEIERVIKEHGQYVLKLTRTKKAMSPPKATKAEKDSMKLTMYNNSYEMFTEVAT